MGRLLAQPPRRPSEAKALVDWRKSLRFITEFEVRCEEKRNTGVLRFAQNDVSGGCSVARNVGVDGAGPVVDAAGEGLRVLEALVAQPHGDGERTLAVMAEDDDGLVG